MKQYELNNNFIIVPVSEGENEVHFSLPNGVWTNFNTGREYYAGKHTEHPISSEPIILIRENSIIIENSDEGCILHVYALCNGIRADADIYESTSDEPVLSVSFKRNGRSIHVAADGSKPYTVRMVNMYAKSAANGFISIEGNDSVITPDAWSSTMEIKF